MNQLSYLWYALCAVLVLLLWRIVHVLRAPKREMPQQDDVVLSPVDGCIVAVEKVNDPCVPRRAIKMSLLTNVCNFNSARSVVDGKVQKICYSLGSVWDEARNNALLIKAKNGQEVTLVQKASIWAHRLFCLVKEGDTLRRGQRYGLFGSRVDVYLPLDANVKVSIGDKVSATTTILATLTKATLAKDSSHGRLS